jgi:putative PIN family toxin of toxin-antitoxin system
VKAVIDTNVILTIISKKSRYRWIFDYIIVGKIELCVSTEILFEYREILELKTGSVIAENILKFIFASPYLQKTDVYYNFNLISIDQSDNKFVDCAISAGSLIISNDKHFRSLKSIGFPKVDVFTLDEFDFEFKSKISR